MKNKEGKTLYYDPKTNQARNFNIPKGAKFKAPAKKSTGGAASKPKARPGKPGESAEARREATRPKNTSKPGESAAARAEASRPKTVKRNESAAAVAEATRKPRGQEQRFRPAPVKGQEQRFRPAPVKGQEQRFRPAPAKKPGAGGGRSPADAAEFKKLRQLNMDPAIARRKVAKKYQPPSKRPRVEGMRNKYTLPKFNLGIN